MVAQHRDLPGIGLLEADDRAHQHRFAGTGPAHHAQDLAGPQLQADPVHRHHAAVAQRAGVSRGAAQHHFPTREALISATLEQIFDDLTLNADTLIRPDADESRRVRIAVEQAVSIYTGTEFKASLQIWAAATQTGCHF